MPSSDAASARSMIFCQRSGVITVTLGDLSIGDLSIGDLSVKISFGPSPLALHGHGRDLHYLGGFVNVQPAKEAQLYNLALPGIKRCQACQGVVECNQV